MMTLDHILWAVPDRDQGIAEIERLSGIRAALGGSHPGRGTRNALVSLGDGRYLEIIAPDPEQTLDNNLGATIKAKGAPGILTFCVRGADLEGLGRKAAAANVPFRGPEAWSRKTPAGDTLHWRLAFTEGTRFGNFLPFYIDWLDTPHPASTTPGGIALTSFAVLHPEAEALGALYAALGIDLPVTRAAQPMLRASFTGPRGEFVLTS
jgi:hypothetical protein